MATLPREDLRHKEQAEPTTGASKPLLEEAQGLDLGVRAALQARPPPIPEVRAEAAEARGLGLHSPTLLAMAALGAREDLGAPSTESADQQAATATRVAVQANAEAAPEAAEAALVGTGVPRAERAHLAATATTVSSRSFTGRNLWTLLASVPTNRRLTQGT